MVVFLGDAKLERTQYRTIKRGSRRHVILVILLLITVSASSLLAVQSTADARISKALVAQTRTNNGLKAAMLDQNVFLKSNQTAEQVDQQLKAAGYVGTALVVHQNQVILQQGYGYADKAKDQLNNAQSLFQIASLQKSFTATLIMQQVQAGKLSLDTLLSNNSAINDNDEWVG